MATDADSDFVNPLDPGNGAHTVESAAQGFTEMLEKEDAPSSSGTRKGNDRNSARKRERERDGEGGEGKARRERDSSHDKDPPESEGGDGDDDPALREDILGERPSGEPEGDDEEGEEGDGDPDDEEGEEGDGEGEDDDTELMNREVEIEGFDKPVKVSELVNGYMRDADYRQKTTRVAADYREVQDFAKETVEQRKSYETNAQIVEDLVTSLVPSEADWAALKAKDPNAFIAAQEHWQGIFAKLREIKASREKAGQDSEGQATRERKIYVDGENRKLFEAVPALANPKRRAEFRSAIFAYGKKAGYSEEELTKGAVDHRDIITLYKASRYDQIMESRKAGSKKGQNNGKRGNSPARAISRNSKSGNSSRQRQADARLARTGKQADAALAFSEFARSEL